MSLVFMTQYFDMLKDVGDLPVKCHLIPSFPGGMDGISQEIIKAITASSKIR